MYLNRRWRKISFTDDAEKQLEALRFDQKRLGKQLKSLRKARGLTQEQLAEKVGISGKFVSAIECGQRRPGLDTCFRLAQVLESSVDCLLKEEPAVITEGQLEREQ